MLIVTTFVFWASLSIMSLRVKQDKIRDKDLEQLERNTDAIKQLQQGMINLYQNE